MQRLLRQPKSHFSTDQVEQANQAIELLQKHVSPVCAQLFAVPVLLNPTATQSELDWLSHRTGQISPYATLSEPEQQKLLAEAAKQAEVVRELQKILEEKGLSSQAQSLTPMTANPNPQHLYAVDGQPVLINWLDAQPPAPAPPAPPPPVAATLAPPAAVVTHKKRHWLWLLLLLLLLLLVGAAAWWWFLQQNQTTNPATEIVPAVINDVAAPPEKKIATTVYDTKFACQTETTEPPEFTIVFDTSNSMRLNVGITKAEEDWYFSGEATTAAERKKEQELDQGLSRLSVAKNAMALMINELHPKIPVQLISFKDCGAIRDHGLFTPAKRSRLLSTISNLKTIGGTPSGKALHHASQQMNGVDKKGIIIFVIDGEDGCGDNICQIAGHIAQTKPQLRVNVVDVSGFGLSDCVAEKTGGRIYSSSNTQKINEMIRDSIEEVSTNPDCN